MKTLVQKVLTPSPIPTTNRQADGPQDRLAELRSHLATIRVRASAMAQVPEWSPQSATDSPMVQVFQPPGEMPEALVGDRDVTKRQERIRAVLADRGPYRVLGAVASAPLAEALSSLYVSHPNFSAAVDYLLGEEMLARQKSGALGGQRLLLTGGAGFGKTDFALKVAELLSLPSKVISMSSSQAAAALGGSETFWSNSQPGAVWEALIQGHYANPIFILDEIEKVASHWGDPLGALYQLAEPKTAQKFCDKSVPWLAIDASHIIWIATANDPGQLHDALRSRFIEIPVELPSEEHLRGLVQRLYGDLLREFNAEGRFPPRLTASTERALSRSSIRETKRLLRSALGLALRTGAGEISVPATERPSPRRIGFVGGAE